MHTGNGWLGIWRVSWGVVLALALLFVACEGPARASVPMHVLARSAAGPVMTDAGRWAAYEPRVGVTRLIDDRSGRSVDRPDPTGCGQLVAVGSGQLLYQCAVADCPTGEVRVGPVECEPPWSDFPPPYLTTDYKIVDATTGHVRSVAGADHLPGPVQEPGDTVLDEVGTQWVAGDGGAFFMNWHTGQIVSNSPRSDRQMIDLDDAGLSVPICPTMAGVYRSVYLPDDPHGGALYLRFSFVRPFALAFDPAAPQFTAIGLLRCGSRRLIALSPTRGIESVSSVQLGGGVASWITQPFDSRYAQMYATQLMPKRQLWHGQIHRLTRAQTNDTAPLLAHTGSHVYASETTPTAQYDIYTATLP
jgi:hypothetical protein